MARSSAAMMLRAVLWDLDGTLADSREYHFRSWVESLGPAGITITEAQFLSSFGQRNPEILASWLGAHAPAERIRQLGEAKEERYRELIREGGLVPLPGAAEWVQRLHEAGWRQAIASSAPRLNVEVMMQALGLDHLMDALIAAEDVRVGKPDPEVFLTAAAALSVQPDRCIVVEDAAAGIEAARRAGMRAIGVGAGAVHAADVTVDSLDQLPLDIFERL